MGADVVTVASTMMCSHGGTVTVVPGNTKVKCVGAFAMVQSDVAMIAGCPFTVPPGSPLPCVAAQVLVASTRVKVGGKPIVTKAGVLMTTGMGPPVPVTVVSTQARVKAI